MVLKPLAASVAMVSRVSLGHSGRALEADALTWWVFLGLLATAAVRALADLWFVPPALRLWLRAQREVVEAAGAQAGASAGAGSVVHGGHRVTARHQMFVVGVQASAQGCQRVAVGVVRRH